MESFPFGVQDLKTGTICSLTKYQTDFKNCTLAQTLRFLLYFQEGKSQRAIRLHPQPSATKNKSEKSSNSFQAFFLYLKCCCVAGPSARRHLTATAAPQGEAQTGSLSEKK